MFKQSDSIATRSSKDKPSTNTIDVGHFVQKMMGLKFLGVLSRMLQGSSGKLWGEILTLKGFRIFLTYTTKVLTLISNGLI